MSEIQTITQAILQFRDERDWAQFHNGKDLAALLNVEAGDLLELFLWKKPEEAPDMPKLRDELADVLYAAFLLASHTSWMSTKSLWKSWRKTGASTRWRRLGGGGRKMKELSRRGKNLKTCEKWTRTRLCALKHA
jgi:NTP pyrophosphatase (non-canonical NTP hydrolase)